MRLVLACVSAVAGAAWLILQLGCCTVRTVSQAGLVPFSEPDPPPSSRGAFQAYASGSGLTHLDATGSATSGDYVPAGQLHLGMVIRPIGGLMIQPMALIAFASGAGPVGTGATPATPTTGATALTTPSSTTFAAGFDIGYVFGDEDAPYLFRPHVGVSYLGVATTFSDPVGSAAQGSIGSMAVVHGGFDVGGWALPWLLLVASFDARNMPQLPTLVTTCTDRAPPFVDFGGITFSMGGNVQVEVTQGFGFFGGVSVPVYGSAFVSYPIVSGGIRGTLGDGRAGLRRPRRPPPERVIDESGDDP